MGIVNGLKQIWKATKNNTKNGLDHFWLREEGQKAIRDEVEKKFKSRIDLARAAENKRAANIKDLGDKLNQSKKDLQDAQKAWQDKYNTALADAKAQRQTDINNYDTELQRYQDAVDNAKAGRQSIVDQLYQQEATYTPTRTIYTDVNTGERYLLHPLTGEYKNITQIFQSATAKQKRDLLQYIKGFDERLLDNSSGTPKVINAFDEATSKSYRGNNNIFDNYLDRVGAPKRIDLRNADDQITKANNDLTTWKSNTKPQALDENRFKTDFNKNNAQPTEYSFNGKNYSKEADLNKAYKDALAREQTMQSLDSRRASRYASKRDAEIAKRIQDAKDVNKAKLALGGTLGAGALYAGAKAIYGGDDTDTTDTTDNTDNTYTGEPDPDFNVEKEGQAILKDRQQIDTDFNPDKAEAEAVLAGAAYDKGVEDGNSIRSSADLINNIGASTRGNTMDDRLYELIKAMKDPYKADAIANYIYSRHGDDPEVQNLGWRGWLNKYYGDSLRSIMHIDPSGYKGMHVSGGL